MKRYVVLLLERHVRQHSDFHGASSEIGARLDEAPPLNAEHNRRETWRRRRRVSHEVTAEIAVLLRFRRRKQPYVQESVCLWIDCGVQPKLLAIDSDHRLVERNVIRTRIVSWL